MIKCTECGIEKEATEFHKRKASKNGLQTMCKTCFIAYAKQWRIDNREQSNKNKAKWCQKKKNKKKIAKYKKKYYKKNKEKLAEYNKKYFKQWYLKNKERIAEKRKQYYRDNKEKIMEQRNNKIIKDLKNA